MNLMRNLSDKIIAIILLSGLLMMLGACSPTKTLNEAEYLLSKNKIKTKGEQIDKELLYPRLRQNPNKRILFVFRFHLGAYNIGSQIKKENWLKRTLTQSIGEPPVVLDTNSIDRSASQIELFLNSKGYFNSIVNYKIEYPKGLFRNKHQATVVYTVYIPSPYTLRNTTLDIEDKRIELIVKSTFHSSLLQASGNYDEDLLSQERDRITNLIRSKGYYYFSKDNIRFVIDTNLTSNQFDLSIRIPNMRYRSPEKNDTLVKKDYKRYLIRHVHFIPDKITSNQLIKDSIPLEVNSKNYYYFTYEEDFEYNSRSLERLIFIKPGNLFDHRDVSQTFRSLTQLNNFRYNNINFTEIDSARITNDPDFGEIDCIITYTRSNRRNLTTETELRNTFGSLGVAGSIGYINRNIFKGAENFRLSCNGALEVQPVSDVETKPSGIIPFNTYEAGINSFLDFPRFLVPISQKRFPRYFKPKTTINIGYNYQKRPDYTRYIANTSIAYDWHESQYKRHIVNPLEINFIKIFPTDEFIARINRLDPVIRNAYSDHMITATKYTFLFTNQDINKARDFVFFRYNLEFAGNTSSLLSKWIVGDVDPKEGYKVFNIRFAQYVRTELDFRIYKYLNASNIFAFRTAVGYGVPYGNSLLLPFEKSFFAGGANSIRAWNIRTLGPGGYNDQLNPGIDKIGDIVLESSFEYRFPVYKVLKSAFFIDAGNIWLQRKNDSYPEGEFQFNRFYKEIAMATGFGLRLDFSFFIIRGDFAIPVRNPELKQDERWVIGQTQLKDFRFKLGIGYPF